MFKVSHLYGFGLMDAEAMVKEAERWKQVPTQHICVESADRQIRYGGCGLSNVTVVPSVTPCFLVVLRNKRVVVNL